MLLQKLTRYLIRLCFYKCRYFNHSCDSLNSPYCYCPYKRTVNTKNCQKLFGCRNSLRTIQQKLEHSFGGPPASAKRTPAERPYEHRIETGGIIVRKSFTLREFIDIDLDDIWTGFLKIRTCVRRESSRRYRPYQRTMMETGGMMTHASAVSRQEVEPMNARPRLAVATLRSISLRCVVDTVFITWVSSESRLRSSPVRVVSKKPMSCGKGVCEVRGQGFEAFRGVPKWYFVQVLYK